MHNNNPKINIERDSMKEISLDEIKQVIDNKVNNVLGTHLGSCEIISYDKERNTATLKLYGTCAGCPSSNITLYNGIVPILQEHFPDLQIDLAL